MTRNDIAVLTPEASPRAKTGVLEASEVETVAPSWKPLKASPLKDTCSEMASVSKPEERSVGMEVCAKHVVRSVAIERSAERPRCIIA